MLVAVNTHAVLPTSIFRLSWDCMQSFLCPDGCLQLEVVPQPLGWEAVCRLSCLPSWAHVVHKKCKVSLQLIYQYI